MSLSMFLETKKPRRETAPWGLILSFLGMMEGERVEVRSMCISRYIWEEEKSKTPHSSGMFFFGKTQGEWRRWRKKRAVERRVYILSFLAALFVEPSTRQPNTMATKSNVLNLRMYQRPCTPISWSISVLVLVSHFLTQEVGEGALGLKLPW